MTDLEQLAKIIADHFYRTVGTDRKYHCQCGEKLGDRTTVDRNQYDHIAQAIIDAGWTGPMEPETTTCADCGEPLTGDKYTGNWVMTKPVGGHWQHVHRYRCPILDRPLQN